MRFKIIALGLLYLLILSCFSCESPTLTIQLQGVVTDAIDGYTIQNVEVSLWREGDITRREKELETDITGESGFYNIDYEFRDIECISSQLRLVANALEGDYFLRIIPVICKEELQVVDIELDRVE